MAAGFKTLEETTAEDWARLQTSWTPFLNGLAGRVLTHLELMTFDHGGLPVTQLEHSLQTATRAHRDGRDEEYVVCALLHDLGDMLAPTNHADFIATLLQPYISEQNHWMLSKHAIFQGYYFWHHWGLNRDERDKYRGHPWFDYTADFCALYDQTSFEYGYDTMPLEAFRPMVERVLAADRLASRL